MKCITFYNTFVTSVPNFMKIGLSLIENLNGHHDRTKTNQPKNMYDRKYFLAGIMITQK